METSKLKKPEIVQVTINLRKAEVADLAIDKKTLKRGQPFWLKSMITGKFDNRMEIINIDTDPGELAEWLRNDMIYVPASSLES
tara:strand:- start:1170 stop:1421 length:252 start_codon:yes stop_codon:yes gene_type:complete